MLSIPCQRARRLESELEGEGFLVGKALLGFVASTSI
jgi:hypothetical protein